MPILRLDATTQDWVIFAPERSRPPVRAAAPREPGPAGGCPFCPGHEKLTPSEVYAERPAGAANSPGWTVRVVPNRFPALQIEETTLRRADGEFFRSMGGCGAHEVIVESPRHDVSLGQQPVEQIEAVLRALQHRHSDLMRDVRFQAVVLFKNHGVRAGTTLEHPHFQLIAAPVVPRLLRQKHAVATDFFDGTGRCLYCVLLAQEIEYKDRIIAANDLFVAFAPYASHVPFETWLLPRTHQSSFGRVDATHLRPLAELLRDVLCRLHAGLENPDFNLTINTVARGDQDKEYFLWHIQIVPRLSAPSGFELGSGMTINTVLPEQAAAFLRNLRS